MSDEIVIRWRKSAMSSADEPDISEQRRTVVDRGGSLWAVGVEDSPTRWLIDTADRKTRFAALQRRHYTGLKARHFNLPPSSIRIVRDEAHPLALYVATEEIGNALASMGHPRAITVPDVAARFSTLAAPLWLHDCGDGDFVDFAMDAAGYAWTEHRIGPERSHMSKIRYVFVLRDLEHAQRIAAIKEFKASARKTARK